MAEPDVTDVEEPLELTHTGVFVHKRNHVVVSTIVDAFAEDKRDHALVYHWIDDDWSQHLIDDSVCSVVALGSDPVEVFNVGVNGNIVIARIPGGEAKEAVDISPRGPNYSETLRCARVIDGRVYVAGMARQVYRRDGAAQWSAIDSGVYVPRGQRQNAVGFLDIDGTSDGRLYAAGYKGEIWMRDQSNWHQETSPTSVALTKVLATSSGEVVICGLAGVLLKGSAGQWAVVAEGETKADFWGLAEFRDVVYVASSNQLFALQGTSLQPVDFGLPNTVSTSYLHSADGVLWSVGPKDIVFTDNGVDWHVIPNP